ncbi:hypothetical protein GCM10007416_24510 [Kroppenstedtia guangzhouensis]|uniref:ATPase n=1 Tax=Kroppenstedtia guangzhouensis TaxID=1274356 RepID=A0ABQ1GVS5_9BACL|nr:DUF6079 family protein [Kroppenstedtia guangzhouensis]GGA50458.1 hypothetical protein GCM10007416_24510 [Kroppenstedtia guangzhouensis]
MKYRELVHFEPIESIIRLTDANQQEYAYQLLDTYVISDRMAELLDELVIEQLQMDRYADNKGLLIVGNYGTGKSHLMSVISTVAEMKGTCAHLSNQRVAQKAKEIEGKFKVIRVEIGSSKMSLRDIICSELEDSLERIDVDFQFPPADQVHNNKNSLMEMMAAFHEVYPEQGLLLVVDELLDHLRTRKEQELALDLGFLREIGEFCGKTRFRFIAGVQEMLFDNPNFHFVADQLRRVKERFEQVNIVREDIAYVVSRRLLKKDEKQKAFIREHLQKFTPLYHKLNEKLEEYVSLFPVHPAYLSTFEKVSVAEKRVILKTISNEMKKVMDQEVPQERPGVISYDSYWPYIENDASLKGNADVKEVMNKTKILQDRIQNAFTRPMYRPLAMRIIHALAVFRLTTDDIYSPVGVTPEELRDDLFLHTEVLDDKDPSGFLRGDIEVTLREILKTVSWQYISTNEANGQYYLDIKKDIAVDDLIEQKSETLSDDQLDRYYFKLLAEVTENSKTSYRSGYRIWLHELPWHDRKVTRQGYLFFGAPNERSTAQPERDFYVYFLQPFDPPKFKDEEKPDEVFFKFVDRDEHFMRWLRLYAGAEEMKETSASSTRRLYEEKADGYRKQLVEWFRQHMPTAFKITYRGVTKKLAEWSIFAHAHATVREIIDEAAGDCLKSWFEEKYPEYPSFSKLSTPITKASLPGYAVDAIKDISSPRTQNGTAILSGLVLLGKDQKLNVRGSGFADWVLEKLEAKGPGQVLNRSELIETVQTVQGTEDDIQWTVERNLEPEFFAVVLAALVYSGDIVITIDGTTYDAMKWDELIRLPLNQLTQFSHISKSGDLPLRELEALFEMLNVNRALLKTNALEQGIGQMVIAADRWTQEAAIALKDIRTGIPTWEGNLLSDAEIQQFRHQLEELKKFMEHIQVYQTPAKLRKFRYSVEEIQTRREDLQAMKRLQQLQQKTQEWTRSAQYLVTAQNQLAPDHPWQKKVDASLKDLLQALKSGEAGYSEQQRIRDLKAEYQNIYLTLHNQSRLNATQHNQQQALLQDCRLDALKQLSVIDLLPFSALDQWYKQLKSLKSCWSLTPDQLESQPICPHCQFRPKEEPRITDIHLDEMEGRLQTLLEDWTEILISNLSDSEVKKNIELLRKEQQLPIRRLIEEKEWTFPIEEKLIQAIQELLQGIDRVEISMDQVKAMMGDGSPLTIDELRNRFERMLQEQVGSQPGSNVRIMLKEEEAHHERKDPTAVLGGR